MESNIILTKDGLQILYKARYTKWNRYYTKQTLKYLLFFTHANDYIAVAQYTDGKLSIATLQIGTQAYPRPDVVFFLFTLYEPDDMQNLLMQLKQHMHANTRLFFVGYNHIWKPLIRLATYIGFMQKKQVEKWLSKTDIKTLLLLEGIEIYHSTAKILLPFYIPVLSFLFNNIVANLPFFSAFALNRYYFTRYAIKETTEPQ